MKKFISILAILTALTAGADTHYPIPDIRWSAELQKAAESGDIAAQRNLGICLLYELGIKADENEAFPWFKKAADKGDPEAQTYVGDFYYGEFGDLFEDKESEAYKWYKKAADRNFPYGIYLLAECYNLGDGVEEDEAKYLELLRKAADMRCSEAAYDLAFEYKDGKHLPQDISKYYEYMIVAAEEGIPMAMINMGIAYYKGEGVTRDYNRAFRFLNNSVKWIESGDHGYGWMADGMRMLSACYRYGRGTEVNKELADKYLEIASYIDKNDREAIREALRSIGREVKE